MTAKGKKRKKKNKDIEQILRQRCEQLNKQLLQANQKLKELTLVDAQTGLYNYRYFEDALSREFYRAQRYDQSLSLAMVDIDYFRSLNEMYGHRFGDTVIKQVARLFTKAVRRCDVVIRFGGAEFVIISPGTGRLMALALSRRLLSMINRTDFGKSNIPVKLKVSIGIAAYPEDTVVKSADLIRIADHNLFRAKEDGGDRVYSSDDVLRKTSADIVDECAMNNNTKFLREKIDRLRRRANQSLVEAVFAFAHAIKLKDSYTGEHVASTVYYAIETGRMLGLGRGELEKIKQAAMLHDLGKIGISERILLKKSKLTKREFNIIKRHPVIGADIIRPIHFLHGIIPYILYHHERWDGAGYPSGLKKKEIPVGARIIALADVYHALISNRPYRSAFSKSKAVQIIRDASATQFDPKILKVFLGVTEQEISH